MSLNYGSSTCTPPANEQEAIFHRTLCELTVIIGMPELTEQTAPEFYARIHMMELTGGTFFKRVEEDGLKDLPVTPAMLQRWIGLKTNASKVTRAQFLKKFEYALKDYEKEYTAELKEAEAA
jgi:hypothetical protein